MAVKKKASGGDPTKTLPGWFATWSDMVTLMFCFFVMLFSMSTLDASKFQVLAESFRGQSDIMGESSGGRGIDDLAGSGIIELPNIGEGVFTSQQGKEETQEILQGIQDLTSGFKTYFGEYTGVGVPEVISSGTTVTLIFDSGIMFDSGSADIKPDAIPILEIVAAAAFEFPDNLIEIEGHTDDVPMNNEQFATNWHLSAGRATSVLVYFIEEKGIAPTRVSSRGFGEYHPIATNDTPEGRARNRRVEIRFIGIANPEENVQD